MPQAIIPWEPGNIPSEIQDELNRRRANRGLKFSSNDNFNDPIDSYKGPMSTWVRFCSNGAGISSKDSSKGSEKYDKSGFVLYGGKNFYTTYGFSHDTISEDNQSIIGYTPTGERHIIDNDILHSQYPIHVPTPEIERISVSIQNSMYRRATVEWVCFSSKQLEYMTPYFLVPGLSCILEWGWNHFNPESLLALDDISKLKTVLNNPYILYTDGILKSRGNYDVLSGTITLFEWSIEGNKIKCRTEITSPDRLYAGVLTDSTYVLKSPEVNGPTIESDSTPKPTNVEEKMPNGFFQIFSYLVTGPLGPSGINIKQTNTDVPVSFASSLKQFVNDDLRKIKNLYTISDPFSAPPEHLGRLHLFFEYVKHNYPNTWKDILYGVYSGRSLTNEEKKAAKTGTKVSSSGPLDYTVSEVITGKPAGDFIKFIASSPPETFSDFITGKPAANAIRKVVDVSADILAGVKSDEVPFKYNKDWDVLAQDKTWINMGMLVEILNYHCRLLKSYNETEMFRIDIGDCVIGAHPNLLSTDGSIMLIPNGNAPKYFVGNYAGGGNTTENYLSHFGKLNPKKLKKDGSNKPDIVLSKVCYQFENSAYRDDIDVIINELRYINLDDVNKDPSVNSRFSFPSQTTINGYRALYSGYLKDIYFNIIKFREIVNDSATYIEILQKVLIDINSAGGNFWDFRIVNSTGKDGNTDAKATMKVVDYNFTSAKNKGNVFTFDWYDSDSLLQNIKFTPTFSNEQATRTLYSVSINSFNYKDRLYLDKTPPIDSSNLLRDNSFSGTMKTLQNIEPTPEQLQVTVNNQVKRLVMPYPELLNKLLDDGDFEYNPKYVAIMKGIQAQFTIQGIGGLRTFMMFLVKNLPEPYSQEDVVFRIIDLTETLDNGKWTTVITAGLIPLNGFIKSVLGLTEKND
jgi:hypothetical protein